MKNLILGFSKYKQFKAFFLYGIYSIILLSCSRYELKTSGNKNENKEQLKIQLSGMGEVEDVVLGGKIIRGNFKAATRLLNCDIKLQSARKTDGGAIEFIKKATHHFSGKTCTIKERFSPLEKSIRWEVEIVGDTVAWSTPISTLIDYPSTNKVSYWTAWGRPQISISDVADKQLKKELKLMNDEKNNWLNPLMPIPFTNSTYYYGAPPLSYENPEIAFCPTDFSHMKKKYNGALFSIPLVSIIDKQINSGISFILSPEDYIQDLTMETSESGNIKFDRLFHRIVNTNVIKFAIDIVAHKPDWRSGMDWMYNRYSDYFEPVNQKAKQLHGTGAYSNLDVAFDEKKMKDMAFTVNWKASFDFPYMGMFLPPVKNDIEIWKSFDKKENSIKIMSEYAKKIKDSGFYVLNYFNVTEFGAKVKYPFPAKSTEEGEEWKNCNDFLNKNLKDAILRVPKEMNLDGCIYSKTKHNGPHYTWEDALVMDCGVPSYRNFLLEQAQRHIDKMPNSFGFCIDRMDWLRMFNENRNDGVSWFANKPVSSMVVSWQQFMEKLGPMVHKENKVIFVNNHTKRIDLLKQTDGFFDEFTYGESPLNLTAFTAIKKPFSGWTTGVENIKEDGPDNFFQKYLYMGAFPMCPFPGNDHSIRPDQWVDQQYLDYGPLLKMMQGREWVLSANPVRVDGSNAKANVFKVADGYIIPVVFGDNKEVTVSIALPGVDEKWQTVVQYPEEKVLLKITNGKMKNGRLILHISLKRGCGLIKLIEIPLLSEQKKLTKSEELSLYPAPKMVGQKKSYP